MPVPSSITDLSTTASLNYPAGTDSIGNTLDNYLRSIQAIVKQQYVVGANIASSTTITPTADGYYFNVTGTTTITTIASTNSWNGRAVFLEFAAALTLTHNASTLILPGSANITTAAGDVAIFVQESSGSWRCISYNRANGTAVAGVPTGVITSSGLTMATARLLGRTTASSGAIEEISVGTGLDLSAGTLSASATTPRSYLAGLTLSTAGSSATMTIAAGQAADSTNAALMSLASALNKTTSSWAVGSGNGGLDTGTIANNTWYHFYAIRRPDTGVVDVVFSTSASSPTLPTNYTQFRRIGSGRTNGSAQWTSFIQYGDTFLYLSPVLDVSATNPGTSAVSRTLSTPTGIVTQAIININLNEGGSRSTCYLSELSLTDLAPSNTVSPLATVSTSASGGSGDAMEKLTIYTNTSSQIRSRLSFSDASTDLYIATLGWIDDRGRNA